MTRSEYEELGRLLWQRASEAQGLPLAPSHETVVLVSAIVASGDGTKRASSFVALLPALSRGVEA